MRSVRLSTLLVALNAGLLLIAVAGVVATAVQLLQQLADAQALARVEQAAQVARQQVTVAGERLLTSAELLSERPTLRRLVETDDRSALTAFLEQFQKTSQLDGTAVFRRGSLVAQTGSDVPWPAIVAGSAAQGALLHGAQEGLLLGAATAVPSMPDVTVAVVTALDAEFAAGLARELDLPVIILDKDAAQAPGPRARLRAQALTGGQTVGGLMPEEGAYVAAAALHGSNTTGIGIIEAELSAATTTRSVRQLTATLLGLACGVAVLAAVLSLLLGRRIARPLGTLTASAARIGRGDLETPIPVAPGAEIGLLAATLDDMRRRLLQLTHHLRRQQVEAAAIVTGIVEGVYSVDQQRRIRFLNPQAAALLGTTPEAAIGRFCGDVLHSQGVGGVPPCAEHCPIIHARFRDGARSTEQLLLPNGQRRTVVITSAPVVDGLQVQVLRDETEIETTRRLRDAILANISHEFRTPLSAQLASIELLLDQLPDLRVEQIGQLVRSQQRGTLRLMQLIDNLLESARIEAGQHTIRSELLALDGVIEGALELMRPLHDQRAQMVVVDLPYPLPPVHGDARRLTQVFVNLLGNAHKFAPPNTTITIGGAVEDACIRVWVEDKGPGLPALAGPALFERFVRAQADEPEQSGVGLGLWIVKWIVERHGGYVDAQDTGHGARMLVVLPQGTTNEATDRRR